MVFYDTPTLSITIIITAEVADQIEDKGPVNDWPWPLGNAHLPKYPFKFGSLITAVNSPCKKRCLIRRTMFLSQESVLVTQLETSLLSKIHIHSERTAREIFDLVIRPRSGLWVLSIAVKHFNSKQMNYKLIRAIPMRWTSLTWVR